MITSVCSSSSNLFSLSSLSFLMFSLVFPDGVSGMMNISSLNTGAFPHPYLLHMELVSILHTQKHQERRWKQEATITPAALAQWCRAKC